METTRNVNQEQIAALFRTALQVVSFTMGWTFLDDNLILSVSSFIATAAVTVWGLWARRDVALVQSAEAVPTIVGIQSTSSEVIAATGPIVTKA